MPGGSFKGVLSEVEFPIYTMFSSSAKCSDWS